MHQYYDYQFDAAIAYHDVGSDWYQYTVVYLPDELKSVLPLKDYPRLRISGEINDCPFEAALTAVHGNWYMLFSRKTLNAIDQWVGDVVFIRFNIADQNAVDIPDILNQVLAQNASLLTI